MMSDCTKTPNTNQPNQPKKGDTQQTHPHNTTTSTTTTKPQTKKPHKKRKAPTGPLTPPPQNLQLKSRKRARQITTLFHKYSSQYDHALSTQNTTLAAKAKEKLDQMGGRAEYQRASELSTSFHSTSKWVLGVLGRIGWLDGIPVEKKEEEGKEEKEGGMKRKRKKVPRRNVKLLEVGAINTQLLDAAARTKQIKTTSTTTSTYQTVPVHKLTVQAIDLRSSHPGIQTQDFLTLPLQQQQEQKYDVIVCSMVLNCVSTPCDRGKMICLLYHQLRPGGLCFLTLPKLCLSLSRYVTWGMFLDMLTSSSSSSSSSEEEEEGNKGGDGVGFELVERKESPKVAFFVLRRPILLSDNDYNNNNNDEKTTTEKKKKKEERHISLNPKFTRLNVINKGKKFRNKFGIVLKEEEVLGHFG